MLWKQAHTPSNRHIYFEIIENILEHETIPLELLRWKNSLCFYRAVDAGKSRIVRLLLIQGLTLDDIRAFNNTALRRACKNGHAEVVKILLDAGLTVSDMEPLDKAAFRWAMVNEHIDVLRELLAHRMITHVDLESEIWRVLQNAALNGDTLLLAFLLEEQRLFIPMDLLRANDHWFSRTILRQAHFQLLRFLLIHKVITEVYIREELMCHALNDAAEFDREKTIEFLMEYGLTINDVRAHQYFALRLALRSHLPKVLPLFLNLGVTMADLRSVHAIALAADGGCLAKVHLLLALGMTVEDVRVENNLALQRAVANGYPEMVQLLLTQGLTLKDVRANNKAVEKCLRIKGDHYAAVAKPIHAFIADQRWKSFLRCFVPCLMRSA